MPSLWQRWFGPKDIPTLRANGDVKGLVKHLYASEYKIWSDALKALEELQALPELMAALTHINLDVRRGAAQALGRLSDPAAVPALAQALRDPGKNFHRIAYSSSGTLSHPVREAAASALAKLGPNGLAVLLEALKYPDLHLVAYLALGEIKGPDAVDMLASALETSEDYDVQKALLERLRDLKRAEADEVSVRFRAGPRNKWKL